MLKSAFSSPKIRLLALKLGIPLPHAIGICGMLWNFTADHAPRGDIGKHSNFQIALAVEWTGDPDKFVRTLIECRLIDESPSHRLLIHDWAEHCPKYVHANLARHKRAVIDASLEKAERADVATDVATPVGTSVAPSVATSYASSSAFTSTSTSTSTSPNLAPTRDAKPSRSKLKDTIRWDPENGWQGITEADRKAWSIAYPACDIDRQLAAADQWLRANPAKSRKALWRKFITGWMSRSQEAGGDIRSAKPATNGQLYPPKQTIEEKSNALAELLRNAPSRRNPNT